jgi:hypothetical protein
MVSVETSNPNEAPTMRRVRNQRIQTDNPSLLFARGIESLVSEHLQHPRYVDEDKRHAKQAVAAKPEPRGNFFTLLMRQFASS